MTPAISSQRTLRSVYASSRERQLILRAILPLLALLCVGAGDAIGAVIPVTTVVQKISSSGGCSLQEAIYSANFDANVAISGYNGSTPIIVTTQCVPGSGDDIIVLPVKKLLRLSHIVDDAYNPAGPTATPIITSTITILAYGATLERNSNQNFRLFTVGNAGHLTIRRAYIRGFRAQGGNGTDGGGGGLGAGGAIFVIGGTLVIEASTFQDNDALGGEGGGDGDGGGGGGIGGNGGPGLSSANGGGAGGGGGARGNGGGGGVYGAGGGGTVSRGAGGEASRAGRGGFDCGGDGGFESDGHDGLCPGGGGGGGGDDFTFDPIYYAKNGGDGHYGGGGGGGADQGNGSGGKGGFGGGGGSAHGTFAVADAGDGGDGGFGGGGGAAGEAVFYFNGDGGSGGFFAGDGSDGFDGGGGGAGLGGAIFNESGTVDIRNSTFSGNTTRGGFSSDAQDGITGGGAIFSVNGHLTVLNSTISGGLAHVGGGILVVQHEESKPTSFVLANTLIAGNGVGECAMTGFTIDVAFIGNLIQSNGNGSEFDGKTFIGCQGVVVSDSDPQLGPLQYNQGATPTMAISAASPARGAADPDTSLPVDQRRQPRPANGGFDIGAYELCLEGPPTRQVECVITVGIDPGEAVQLTIEVQPAGGGTTTPAPGTQQVVLNSVIPLNATPKPGFRFSDWSPNVTNPADIATTVFMDTSKTVTVNFVACACATDVSNSIGVTLRDPPDSPITQDVHLVTLTNNSPATIRGPISLVLDNLTENVTLSNASGSTILMLPADSGYVNAPVPQLAPGHSTTFPLLFVNPDNVPISYTTRVLTGPGSR